MDLNEMNFLVSQAFDEAYFIDADSYQTKHFPAPVLMESVRDWSVQHHAWTEVSDWFSFGIVTFQMFVGLHPFKGKYKGHEDGYRAKLPTDPPDDAFAVTRRRMQHHISVFHPEVDMPAAAYPLTTIPRAYRDWYEQLFAKGKRLPPPDSFGTALVVAAPAQIKLLTGTLVDLEFLLELEGTLRDYFVTSAAATFAASDGDPVEPL